MSEAGYDVAMQYGTTQPDWDLVATKSGRTLKVQVKGSQTGGWGLFQGNISGADYHGALDKWLTKQLPDVVYFFAQFKDVLAGAAPAAMSRGQSKSWGTCVQRAEGTLVHHFARTTCTPEVLAPGIRTSFLLRGFFPKGVSMHSERSNRSLDTNAQVRPDAARPPFMCAGQLRRLDR